MEGNGRIYNERQWTVLFAIFPAVPATTPDIFPFSSFLLPSLPNSSPLRGAISRHPHIQSWIVISSPPQNNALSYVVSPLLSLFSCLGHKLPLSSDFSHPSDVSTFPASHPTRPGVTNHIIQSDLRSPHIGLLNLASSFLLTHLTLTSPHLASIPCSPPTPVRHVPQLHTSLSRALSVPPPPSPTSQVYTWPTRSLVDAHVKALRPLRPPPAPSHR